MERSALEQLRAHIFVYKADKYNLVVQINYWLPYCVTCPSMSTDPGSLNPGTRQNRLPGGGIPGSVRILGQATQFCQNILNTFSE